MSIGANFILLFCFVFISSYLMTSRKFQMAAPMKAILKPFEIYSNFYQNILLTKIF